MEWMDLTQFYMNMAMMHKKMSHPFFILFAEAYLRSESVTPTSVLIQHNFACLLNPVVYVAFKNIL